MIKRLVNALILAFALGFYNLLGLPLWNRWLESMGHKVGIFETVAGFFLVIVAAQAFAHFVTRRMD